MDIQLTTKVKSLKVTASEWQLFTFDKEHRPAANRAARALNATIKKSVNAGLSRNEVVTAVWNTMAEHSAAGACDSEPDYVLGRILDKIFGTE